MFKYSRKENAEVCLWDKSMKSELTACCISKWEKSAGGACGEAFREVGLIMTVPYLH